MAREYDEFRYVLASIKEDFPNTWVDLGELAKAEGKDPRTIRKRYGIPKGQNGIDRAVLARRKCQLAHN